MPLSFSADKMKACRYHVSKFHVWKIVLTSIFLPRRMAFDQSIILSRHMAAISYCKAIEMLFHVEFIDGERAIVKWRCQHKLRLFMTAKCHAAARPFTSEKAATYGKYLTKMPIPFRSIRRSTFEGARGGMTRCNNYEAIVSIIRHYTPTSFLMPWAFEGRNYTTAAYALWKSHFYLSMFHLCENHSIDFAFRKLHRQLQATEIIYRWWALVKSLASGECDTCHYDQIAHGYTE